jgi:hypothetical protein
MSHPTLSFVDLCSWQTFFIIGGHGTSTLTIAVTHNPITQLKIIIMINHQYNEITKKEMIDLAKTSSISRHEYTYSESLKQCCTWTTQNQVYF